MLRALGKPLPELWRPPTTASPSSGGDGKARAAQGERLCPYKAVVWAPVCWCRVEPGGAAAPAPAGMPLKTGTNTARRGRTQALSHTFQAPHSCPYMSRQHLTGRAPSPTPGPAAVAAARPQPGLAAPAHPRAGGRSQQVQAAMLGHPRESSPTPRQHRSGSCCCRAPRVASPKANPLGRAQPAGREEPRQLRSR